MTINIPILDITENPWPEEGGIVEQIAYWRSEITRTGEQFPGESVEFEAFVAANGLENA